MSHTPDTSLSRRRWLSAGAASGLFIVPLPAGTPAALVNRISTDVQMVLREAALRDKIIERGSIPDPRTPAETAEFIRAKIEKWSRVAKPANVRLDQYARTGSIDHEKSTAENPLQKRGNDHVRRISRIQIASAARCGFSARRDRQRARLGRG